MGLKRFHIKESSLTITVNVCGVMDIWMLVGHNDSGSATAGNKEEVEICSPEDCSTMPDQFGHLYTAWYYQLVPQRISTPFSISSHTSHGSLGGSTASEVYG